jgi:tetratricopeptide (TPR) repeat protein
MSIADSVVTLLAQRKELIGYSQFLPLRIRLGNAVLSYGLYLWKTVWPAKLTIYYPHAKMALPWGEVTLAGAVLIAITFVVWRYRSHSYLVFGWLWFLGILVPVIGIVQSGSQAMADRYMYLPLIGILIAVVWAAAELLQRARVSRKIVVLLSGVVLAGLSWNMRIQQSYWRNSITLFTRALEVTTDNPVAEVNLGTALADKGFSEESIVHMKAALAINPHDAVALENLALYHIYHKETARALEELDRAAGYTTYPDVQKRIHMNRGALYSKLGNMEAAKSEYRKAILAQPEDYWPYLSLGVHLYLEGRYDEALANLTQSTTIFPTSTAYYYAGKTLQAEGRLQEAAESYKTALRISPSYDDARQAFNDLVAKMPAGQSR